MNMCMGFVLLVYGACIYMYIAEDQIGLLAGLEYTALSRCHVGCHHTSEPAATSPCW